MSRGSLEGKSRAESPARKSASTPAGRREILRKNRRLIRQAERPDSRDAKKAGSAARGGIRIDGRRGDSEVADALIRYASWLRKKHRFPVRVPVYLLPGENFVTSEGKTVVSSFFAPLDPAQEPYIRIATGDYQGLKRREGRDNALAAFITSLSHDLIYYWQWLETGNTWERGVSGKAVRMLRAYERSVAHP